MATLKGICVYQTHHAYVYISRIMLNSSILIQGMLVDSWSANKENMSVPRCHASSRHISTRTRTFIKIKHHHVLFGFLNI